MSGITVTHRSVDIANLVKVALEGFDQRIIGLDPGQTTGACLFQGSILLDARQIESGLMPQAAENVGAYIYHNKPDIVVMENYKVYEWKTKDHAWASLHTPRLIGALEYFCYAFHFPLVKQMAQMPKGFCTDDKLQKWGYWKPGQRHARDAIRHAVYYMLFEVAKVHQPKPTGGNDVKQDGEEGTGKPPSALPS
jgi:hypothetical protein